MADQFSELLHETRRLKSRIEELEAEREKLKEWAQREIDEDQAAKPFSSGPYINAEHILDFLNGTMRMPGEEE